MPYSVKIMPNPSIRSNRRKSRSKGEQRVVAVLAYDGVNAFELGLAVEVFGLSDMGPDWYRVVVCSERPGQPLVANNGLKVIANSGMGAVARADTIIVPGSLEIVEFPDPASLLDALQRAHRRGARVASICAGAFILAAAGLLDGRRATAHWAHTEALSRRYPRVQVDANVLYVDDGDIMSWLAALRGSTSACTSCGATTAQRSPIAWRSGWSSRRIAKVVRHNTFRSRSPRPRATRLHPFFCGRSAIWIAI